MAFLMPNFNRLGTSKYYEIGLKNHAILLPLLPSAF